MAQYPATIALSSVNGTNGFKLYDGGTRAALAGDVNGDGFADYIIATVPNAMPPPPGDVGKAFVVFGGASNLAAFDAADGSADGKIRVAAVNGTNGFQISRLTGNDYGGYSVSGIGDINGDGFADVVVRNSASSTAAVVFGHAAPFPLNVNPSTLNGSNGFNITGLNGEASIGPLGVASSGDVNGDGFADVILTEWRTGTPHTADIVFGKASGFGAVFNVSSINGQNGTSIAGSYARSAASADINGDGISDTIAGRPYAGPGGNGLVYLVFGSTGPQFPFNNPFNPDGLNGPNGYRFESSAAGNAGYAVASAGDVNGDGFVDLIIGAPHTGAFQEGAAYVVFGGASNLAALDAADGTTDGTINLTNLDGTNGFKFVGDRHFGLAGISVASAGDVNGDGFADVITSSAVFAESYVVFGHAAPFAPEIHSSVLDGTNGFTVTGSGGQHGTVDSAGDINNDGFSDMLFGTPQPGPTVILDGLKPDAAVNRTGTDASQTLAGGDFNDTLSGLGGKDQLYGNGGDDTLNGGDGNDKLFGGAGNDTLAGGAGMDVIDGGTGENTATYAASPDAVQINLAFSSGIGGDANGDVLLGIPDVIGSNFGDVLTGDSGLNKLFGGGGNDWLIGAAGPDLLDGGAGADTAFYDASSAAVRIDLVATTGTGGDAQGDLLYNVENVSGSGFDDLLIGNAGANRLSGNGGNDGLAGGAGADVLNGGDGNDTALYDTSPDAVQVNLAAGAGLNGDAQGDVLTGIENLVGSSFGDVLTGDNNDNRINGGRGADLLTGGGGNDTFVFVVGQANGDRVVDFNGNGAAAGDSLELVGYGADATFTQVDGSHWQVNYHGNTEHDVITFLNGAAGAIHPSDFVFV